VIDAKHWLVAHGWVLVLKGSAADKYAKPTKGAYLVQIIRVDDPTKGCRVCTEDETAPLEKCKNCCHDVGVDVPVEVRVEEPERGVNVRVKEGVEATEGGYRNCTSAEIAPFAGELSAPKVSCSCFSSCSIASPGSNPCRSSHPTRPAGTIASQGLIPEKQESQDQSKSKNKTLASERRWVERYGEQKPDWFDIKPLDTVRRATWCYEHDVKNLKYKEPVKLSMDIFLTDAQREAVAKTAVKDKAKEDAELNYDPPVKAVPRPVKTEEVKTVPLRPQPCPPPPCSKCGIPLVWGGRGGGCWSCPCWFRK
jgi:hypothetical protein